MELPYVTPCIGSYYAQNTLKPHQNYTSPRSAPSAERLFLLLSTFRNTITHFRRLKRIKTVGFANGEALFQILEILLRPGPGPTLPIIWIIGIVEAVLLRNHKKHQEFCAETQKLSLDEAANVSGMKQKLFWIWNNLKLSKISDTKAQRETPKKVYDNGRESGQVRRW